MGESMPTSALLRCIPAVTTTHTQRSSRRRHRKHLRGQPLQNLRLLIPTERAEDLHDALALGVADGTELGAAEGTDCRAGEVADDLERGEGG